MHDNGTMTKTSSLRDHQLTIRIPKHLRDALDREVTEHPGPGVLSVADIVVHALEQRYNATPKRTKGGK